MATFPSERSSWHQANWSPAVDPDDDRPPPDLAGAIGQHPIWQAEQSELAVVLAHFNPCGYRRPVVNLLATLNHLHTLGATAYLAFLRVTGPRQRFCLADHLPRSERVCVLDTSTVWFHKEPLWNYASTTLVPSEVDKILLLDADVEFVDASALTQIAGLLDVWPAVQPFDVVTYLDDVGNPVGQRSSVGHAVASGLPDATRPRAHRAGLGMALRRDFWAINGGLHLAPVGGGDTLLCAALTGSWRALERDLLAQSESSWEQYRRWAEQVQAWSSRRLTAAPTELLHRYHGRMEDRRYDERREYLSGFDPRLHVRQGPAGLPEWSPFARRAAPDMVASVAAHFTQRREDD